ESYYDARRAHGFPTCAPTLIPDEAQHGWSCTQRVHERRAALFSDRRFKASPALAYLMQREARAPCGRRFGSLFSTFYLAYDDGDHPPEPSIGCRRARL